MVDLDSNPTKLIEIVEVGKQLLITRGALTTFSIANDVAKYFAILPAMFAFTYATKPGERGPLNALNIMHLGTPQSAIISAIIFNALIIPALVPLALKGVKYRAIGATALLRRNLLIYGLGGDDPAVHRDQADRPDRPQPLRRVSAWPCAATTGSCSGWRRESARRTACCRRAGRRRTEGRDVVIGYLEPHDRPETAALAEGLEVVPRLRAQHGGARARGDGRRRRHPRARPSWRSIDELAHTNAPGMRNEKRYQDIDEVLAAGIDVISTVNVQHLESLNDAIFELTDVRVRETFPDRDPRRGRRGRARRPLAGGAAGAARAPARSIRSERAEAALAELLPAREPGRAARARAARGRRGRRGTPRTPPCSTRSASRRSPSACSRSSSRSRSRSGSCGAPGARPSGSAREIDALWVQPRGRRADRGGGDAARRAAPARRHPRRPLSRGGRRRPRRDRPPRRRRARLDLRLRRHARRVAPPRDLRRLAPLPHGARAARASTSASSPTAPTAERADGMIAAAVARRRARGRPAAESSVAAAAAGCASRGRRAGSSSRSPAARSTRPCSTRRSGIAHAEERDARPGLPAARPAPYAEDSPLRDEVAVAMPLLEAVEHAALRAGVPGRRADREGAVSPRTRSGGSGTRSTSTASSRPRRTTGWRLQPEGPDLDPHPRAERDARPQALAGTHVAVTPCSGRGPEYVPG